MKKNKAGNMGGAIYLKIDDSDFDLFVAESMFKNVSFRDNECMSANDSGQFMGHNMAFRYNGVVDSPITFPDYSDCSFDNNPELSDSFIGYGASFSGIDYKRYYLDE